MKKILFLLIIFGYIGFVGCNKEDFSVKIEDVDSTEINLQEIVNNFETDYASFSSMKEFFDYSKKFNAISYEEKQKTLDGLKYKSLKTILNEAYEGMNDIETREEFISYLRSYDDYLFLAELSNGEEEVQEIEITRHSVFPLLNADRLIKIGDMYYKYLSEIYVKSQEIESLLHVKNRADAIRSGLDYFTAYAATHFEVNTENTNLRWGELGHFREWEETDDNPWCINDRRAKFAIGTVPEYYSWYDPFLGWLTQLIVAREASVKAYRKGIPCIWYKYTTEITWNNFHCEYDENNNGQINHITWTHADEVKEAKEIVRSDIIWAGILGEGSAYDIQWTDIKSDVTTRGLLPKWINVDEQY